MSINTGYSAVGEMPEWPKGRDWKSRECPQGVPRVRIPLSPPLAISFYSVFLSQIPLNLWCRKLHTEFSPVAAFLSYAIFEINTLISASIYRDQS
jgi:hypothetical protein